MPAIASKSRIRWTVRLRLTLLYGALFLVSGAALLAITYLLVVVNTGNKIFLSTNLDGQLSVEDLPTSAHMEDQRLAAEQKRAAQMRELLIQSGIALALMSTVSIALGWLMAGRALRPVRTMADKARRMSERNLHERLAVSGPSDELKDLGDTFDGLLSRLDTAFEAQKRFVANASHELRTPLTLQRAIIEVALSDPEADAATLRAVCERVLAAGEHQEHLIEALLTLASSQRGLERRKPVDLGTVVADVLRDRPPGPRIEQRLTTARASGDARLVERLVSNLVDNAERHNGPDGWVRVSTSMRNGRAVLRVINSGPEIPPEAIDRLLQPFQRYESRPAGPEGHGLGLSIVAAIATAHGARLKAKPGPEGGLDITVTFPAPASRKREPVPGSLSSV